MGEGLRLGIVGLGSWAREVHLPNLKQVPAITVTGLCSRDARNLEAGQAVLGRPVTTFTDWREFVRWDGHDAVLITAAPNELHEPIALEALEAGKHVLCEKPATLTLEGCARLEEAVAVSGRVYQVGLELRYSDVAQRLKQLVAEGAVGRPAMVWCTILRDWGGFSGWRASKARAGGIHHELACHYMDLFVLLMGQLPERVVSRGASRGGAEVEDYLWSTLEFPNGCLANLGVCMFAPHRDEIPLDLVGDTGHLSAEVIGGSVSLRRRGERVSEDRSPSRAPGYTFRGFPGSLESLQAFAAAVLERRPTEADVRAATQAVRLSIAAERAMVEGRPVTWSEVSGA